MLQDALFTFGNLTEILRSSEVSNAIKQAQVKGSLTVNTFAEGDWSEAHLAKLVPQLQVHLNPPAHVMSDPAGFIQFSAYLSYFLKVVPLKDLLQSSSVVGNIRFSRPTLYIFPSCQGDSALFGISGFNLLVNGGYGRKACFWDFTRHLDRIDAMLVSHLGADNLFGIRAVVGRKAQENVHPEIGYVYMNAVEKGKPTHESEVENDGGEKKSSRALLLNLGDEASAVVEDMKAIGSCVPRTCVGVMHGATLQPTNLYHKVGHGTLDMYVLSPTQDSKALKDFLAQWSKRGNGFNAKGGAVPACHSASVCAILVWKPASPHDAVTRILFPGSAPQAAVFEGLDRLKNVILFQNHAGSDLKGAQAKKGSSGKPQTPKPAPAKSPAPPKQEAKKVPGKKEPQKGAAPSKGKDEKASDGDKKSSTPSSESKSPVGSKQPLASPGSTRTPSEGVASAGAVTPDDPTAEDNKENELENGRDAGGALVDLQSAPPPETVGDLVDLEDPSGGADSEKPDPDEKDVDTKEVASAPEGHAAFDGVSPEGLPSPTAEESLHGQLDKNRVASSDHQMADSAVVEEESSPFDPSKHWGTPMDLPAPNKPTHKSDSSAKSEEGAAAGNDKPAMDLPRKKTSPTKPQASKPLGDEDRSKSAAAGGDPLRKSSTSSVKKGRPGTAPTDAATKPEAKSAPRGPAKKPATSAPAPATKPVTLKPVVPFYVDLAYVPGHGSPHYLDIDFFRRVRARYYVLSTISPDAGVLTALLEAKQMWDDPESEVTIIPTYDADVLRYWMAAHRDQLSQLKIDVAPSANRCSIQLQDHETSCAAYRLEF